VLQLVYVYSVPTNSVLALAASKSAMDGQMSTLSRMLESALQIDRADQQLLTPVGTVADLSADISQYCLSQVGGG